MGTYTIYRIVYNLDLNIYHLWGMGVDRGLQGRKMSLKRGEAGTKGHGRQQRHNTMFPLMQSQGINVGPVKPRDNHERMRSERSREESEEQA